MTGSVRNGNQRRTRTEQEKIEDKNRKTARGLFCIKKCSVIILAHRSDPCHVKDSLAILEINVRSDGRWR